MPIIGDLEAVVLDRVPKFLRNPNLGRLPKAFAAALDGNLEQLRQGLTFSNPLLCPEECLPTIAKDRGLRIPPSMPTEAVRIMLSQWIQLHRTRAHPAGVIRHVRNYFAPGPYPSIQMVHDNGTVTTWHKVDSANRYTKTQVRPAHFPYTGTEATNWGRWYIFIEDEDDSGTPIPALPRPVAWDGGAVYDGGVVWDGMVTQVALDLVSMAVDWKRAGTRMQALIVNRQPGSIGPSTAFAYDPHGTGWSTLPLLGSWKEPMNISGDPTRPPYLDWIWEYD